MKTNHFVIPYTGNKRQEVERIRAEIEPHLSNIATIVEPFCGSAAVSCYLSQKYPGRFKYVLNDMDTELMNLYEIARDEARFNDLIEKATLAVGARVTRESYKEIIDGPDRAVAHLVASTIYFVKPGYYPSDERKQYRDYTKLKTRACIQFLREERVELRNGDWTDVMTEFENDAKALVFIDPPYIKSDNLLYKHRCLNIYDYLTTRGMNNFNAYLVLCVEDIEDIRGKFAAHYRAVYAKQYERGKRRTTTHVIIGNRGEPTTA